MNDTVYNQNILYIPASNLLASDISHLKKILWLSDFKEIRFLGKKMRYIDIPKITKDPFTAFSHDINHIYFKDELIKLKSSDYKCLSNYGEWEYDTYYIKHPINKKLYIRSNDYYDYIIRQQCSSISHYIMSNMKIHVLEIGLISKEKKTSGIKMEKNKFSLASDLSIEIDSEYHWKYCNSSVLPKLNETEKLWIQRFPDIKTAIDHGVKEFSCTVEHNNTFVFSGDIKILKEMGLSVKSSFYKNVKYFLSYTV